MAEHPGGSPLEELGLPAPKRPRTAEAELSEAKAALADEVALEALGTWLASPGSDVEKALRKAMRARHSDLDQDSRRGAADRVLGTAVLWGRLAHLLERELRPGAGRDPHLLLRLF